MIGRVLASTALLFLLYSVQFSQIVDELKVCSVASLSFGEMAYVLLLSDKEWFYAGPIIAYLLTVLSCTFLFSRPLVRGWLQSTGVLRRTAIACSALSWLVLLLLPHRTPRTLLGSPWVMDMYMMVLVQGYLISTSQLDPIFLFVGPSGSCFAHMSARPFELEYAAVVRTLVYVAVALPATLSHTRPPTPSEAFVPTLMFLQNANPIEVFSFVHVMIASVCIVLKKTPLFEASIAFVVKVVLFAACVNFNVACAWVLVQ